MIRAYVHIYIYICIHELSSITSRETPNQGFKAMVNIQAGSSAIMFVQHSIARHGLNLSLKLSKFL